jgi:polysaccharide pyruvyl transferase WcaK-like protein
MFGDRKPATMNRVDKTIGLLDHSGHGNLGDDANLEAVTQNIRSRWPDAKLIGLTLNPYDTERRLGIPSYAIRRDSKSPPSLQPPVTSEATTLKARFKRLSSRCQPLFLILRAINTAIRFPKVFLREILFLVESFRIVRSLDMLIICGGGQLLDWGGPWSFPYTLFKWAFLARLAGRTCYFLNVGAGPLRDFLSKWFVKFGLLLSDYASFRDRNSRTVVQDIGFRRAADVFPDNAYSLAVPIFNIREARPGDRSVVGISPMAYLDPRKSFWEKDQTAFDRYIHQLVLLASSLAREHYRIRLFSTEVSFDSLGMEDIRRALKNDASITDPSSIMHDEIPDAKTLFEQMSSMDYIVTSRYHGVILAHLMNIPVLAISPHPKVATLMNDAGLSTYCLDIGALDHDLLAKTFSQLVENRDDIKRQMVKTAASYKARLQQQFDSLFPVPPIKGRRPLIQAIACQS